MVIRTSSLMLITLIIWCRYFLVSSKNCFTCKLASNWWNSWTYNTNNTMDTLLKWINKYASADKIMHLIIYLLMWKYKYLLDSTSSTTYSYFYISHIIVVYCWLFSTVTNMDHSKTTLSSSYRSKWYSNWWMILWW